MEVPNIFADVGPAISTGLAKLVDAKVTEQVARINRTNNTTADVVTGANVAPVAEQLQRSLSEVEQKTGMSWTTGALFVGGVILAGVLLRGLR